jgi:TRAP-type C4-dicarboxylate transport system substrate-binding protein
MSAALHTYLAAEEPRMGIFNLPGLIGDVKEFQTVGSAFWFQDVGDIWKEKWNARVLAQGAWCTTRLFSKEPIHSIEDFKDKRLRVHNPQTAAMMAALGAKPTPMAMTEIMPALERGVIDGLFTSMCVGAAFEFPREAPHVQDWKLGPVTGWAILVNEDTWQSMPEDVRQQVQDAMTKMQQEAFDSYDSYIAKAQDKLKGLGAEIWSAPDDLAAQLNEPQYAKAAFDSWFARASEVGFDGPAYIDKVRKALGKDD